MKRIFDFVLAVILLLLFLPIVLVIVVAVRLTSLGPALFWSDRIGRNSVVFRMPKFRTMLIETPSVATHLLKDSKKFITPLGSFLRKTSLDELPQLISILKGEMSFVGPRPALFNQIDLIKLRQESSVDSLRPGLTGWAQINGRDEISTVEKATLDKYYLENFSLFLDLRILFSTLFLVLGRSGVRH